MKLCLQQAVEAYGAERCHSPDNRLLDGGQSVSLTRPILKTEEKRSTETSGFFIAERRCNPEVQSDYRHKFEPKLIYFY
jgi:hypothetical protein